MSWKTSAVISGGILSIVCVVCALLVILNLHKFKSEETMNVQVEIENPESSTYYNFIRADVFDAPSVAEACSKGMRFDKISHKCKRIL